MDKKSLLRIIGIDFLRNGKLPILFFVAIVITILITILVTHQTRLMTNEREEKMTEKSALEIEWRNLILEENTLGDQQRVERIAIERLNMSHILPEQEQLIILQR